MGKPKTVITENGVNYQVSPPTGKRTFCKVFGWTYIVLGLVLAIALPPVGLIMAAVGAAMVFWLPKKFHSKKDFLSFAGSPCAGHHTFGNWNPKVHSGQAQIDRFEKAAHQPMKILSYNEHNFAKIQGSGDNWYLTSLDVCSCPDFEKRGRPCKHIYFLAIQMGYTSDDFYSY